jgi:hypothetical protein
MFKFKGIVHNVGATNQVSDKFKKREVVLTDGATEYPQYIPFTFVQDKCSLADSLIEGQEVEFSFSLKGREWTSPQGDVKFFCTIEAFNIAGDSKPAPASMPQVASEDEDLPF